MAEKGVDLGQIQKYMDDPAVSEIMVNGPQRIFIERDGKKILSDAKFTCEEEVMALIERIYSVSGKKVNYFNPFSDVCMEDGTRVNAIIKPLSRFGVSVTFRKFAQDIRLLEDIVRNATLTQKAADLLVACVKGKVNMIFSGGTATGKTTLLQLLSRHFDPYERVITIEDAAELKLEQDDVVSLETRTPDENGKGEVTLRDLIRNALRMAPDRLVIGEVRGVEAIDMLQCMATGHAGTIGIIHGSSPKDVLARLETMVLMSGVKLPLSEIRKMIASTVNIVVHFQRFPDGSRKVTHITEVRGIEKEELLLNDLFTFHFQKMDENGKVIGTLKPTLRYFPLFFQRFQKQGLLSDKIFVSE